MNILHKVIKCIDYLLNVLFSCICNNRKDTLQNNVKYNKHLNTLNM